MTTMTTVTTAAGLADPIRMQHRLFAELSRLFAREVPMYDTSLLVNTLCNRTACDLLAIVQRGFSIADAELERASGERHGAIRIGRRDEYRWVARFFALFGMRPHSFYDMSSVGAKSQPIIATAFRSRVDPEHRVFTSLLMTDSFDGATRARVESLLSKREVFGDRAKALIEKGERQGGLDWPDAEALIREATERIFKWTGRANDHALYTDLCEGGFKIAADIACFERHHLNHLTPNTFCMDLYTSAMKFCMGDLEASVFGRRAERALARLAAQADPHYMRLTFRHLSREAIASFERRGATPGEIQRLADALTARLCRPSVDLTAIGHSGFKDVTEGPSQDTPIFLRQDAYRALTEPATFTNPDGSTIDAEHTARFGEIEQRFYAATPKGRALYERCLGPAEEDRDADPELVDRDFDEYERRYASHFAPFPKAFDELLDAGLIYGRYEPTPGGLAARGTHATADIRELVRLGYADAHGQRYEDFLPVSAAGIFASNLNQYGTASTAASRPAYTRAMLEEVMGQPIIDAEAAYRAVEARSVLDTLAALGVLDRLPPAARAELERAATPSK